MFQNPDLNQKGAQLIFTTHDTSLLDGELLRRDQIWFAEKDEDQASHLYPLSDFSPRKGEALERGYLAGRYGGVPILRTPRLN
jgi:AAA15 family ATPase/GTPase